MNSKIMGAILLASGSGLLVWGYQMYDAVDNKFSRALGGGTSTEAMLVLGGGALCALIGAVVLLRK